MSRDSVKLQIFYPKIIFQNNSLLGTGKDKQKPSLFMMESTLLLAEKFVSDNCACFL